MQSVERSTTNWNRPTWSLHVVKQNHKKHVIGCVNVWSLLKRCEHVEELTLNWPGLTSAGGRVSCDDHLSFGFYLLKFTENSAEKINQKWTIPNARTVSRDVFTYYKCKCFLTNSLSHEREYRHWCEAVIGRSSQQWQYSVQQYDLESMILLLYDSSTNSSLLTVINTNRSWFVC